MLARVSYLLLCSGNHSGCHTGLWAEVVKEGTHSGRDVVDGDARGGKACREITAHALETGFACCAREGRC